MDICKRILRLFLLMAGTAGIALSGAPAHADVWGYVDDSGMTHFANKKVDSRYQLYFKTDNFQFDPRKAVYASRSIPSRSGGASLVFNPAADAAAGTKAVRLVRLINQSGSFRTASVHMQREAARTGVDFDLLKSIIAAESGFNPGAVSGAGAVGLMQIMPDTARSMGLQGDARMSVEQKLADPATNVRLGARYLKFLLNKYPGRVDLAVAAYNAGFGAVNRYGRTVPPFAETQNYVRTVLAIYQTMKPAGSMAAWQPAGASRIPLAGKSHAGRVNMTIAAGRQSARKPAPDDAAIGLSVAAVAPPAEEVSSNGPTAMDVVASKVTEAEAAVSPAPEAAMPPSPVPARTP